MRDVIELDDNCYVGSSNIMLKDLVNNMVKYRNIILRKNHDQSLSGNDYFSHNITWQTISGNKDIKDVVFINNNGFLQFSNRVKMIHVDVNIASTGNISNLMYGVGEMRFAVINSPLIGNKITYSQRLDYSNNDINKNVLNICPYFQNTIGSDGMWTVLRVTIEYI